MITLQEFLELSENDIVKFDFLGQGAYQDTFIKSELPRVDESKLLVQIYSKLYPWYQNYNLYGDSINTYRIAIHKFYGDYYLNLSDDKQQEINLIIKSHTLSHEHHIFSFRVVDTNKKIEYQQISNNYQLGNFCVLPGSKEKSINRDRSQAPYYDFFDLFLIELEKDFPPTKTDQPLLNTNLQKSIHFYSEYFRSFKTFNEYVEKNFFQDFFDDNNNIIRLSKIETFEEYVSTVNRVINKRSQRIARYLTRNL